MKKLGFDLILLGDPTAGKDTQADILKKVYSLKPIESGKHWRAMAKRKNSEGAWLRRTMSLGFPTPVILMKKFIKNNLRNIPKNKNLIFIGNPRLRPEAQLLVKLLNQKKRDFLYIYIKIPVSEILKRTKKRARLKSEDEAVWQRINYFRNQVSKTTKYFKSLKKLKLINGKQSIPKVTKDILKVIDEYQKQNF